VNKKVLVWIGFNKKIIPADQIPGAIAVKH